MLRFPGTTIRLSHLLVAIFIMTTSIRSFLHYICAPWCLQRGFSLDLLTVTAQELQEQLTAGSTTSVELVDRYFEQIEKHDGYLRAILQKSPEARRQAKILDGERRAGSVRGPLHGIPILLKVLSNYNPSLFAC